MLSPEIGVLVVALFLSICVCRNSQSFLYPLPPGPKKLPLLGNLFVMPSTYAWKIWAEWGKFYSQQLPCFSRVISDLKKIRISYIWRSLDNQSLYWTHTRPPKNCWRDGLPYTRAGKQLRIPVLPWNTNHSEDPLRLCLANCTLVDLTLFL